MTRLLVKSGSLSYSFADLQRDQRTVWDGVANGLVRAGRDRADSMPRRFERVLADLRALIETDLARLERQADAAGAPWTPGRVPEWKP